MSVGWVSGIINAIIAISFSRMIKLSLNPVNSQLQSLKRSLTTNQERQCCASLRILFEDFVEIERSNNISA